MASQMRLRNWVSRQISQFLGYEDDGAMADYFLGIATYDDLLEYSLEVMGDSDQVIELINQIWQRKTKLGQKGPDSSPKIQPQAAASRSSQADSNSNMRRNEQRDTRSLQKAASKRDQQDILDAKYGVGSASSTRRSRSRTRSRSRSRSPAGSGSTRGQGVTVVTKKKKSKKRVRRECNCQARRHPLFTNCTACGKVICQEEGEGECFFCGSMVTRDRTIISEEFLEVMEEGNVPVEEREEKDMTEEEKAASLAKAIAHKEKLLAFAAKQGTSSRSTIIDDQADYYNFDGNNIWMSEEEKKKVREKAERLKREREEVNSRRLLNIDIAGGGITAAEKDDLGYYKETDNSQAGFVIGAPEATGSRDDLKIRDGGSGSQSFGSRVRDRKSVDTIKLTCMTNSNNYYANDTLTGRAKRVYQELRQALEDEQRDEKKSAAFSESLWGEEDLKQDRKGKVEQPSWNQKTSSLKRVQHLDEMNDLFSDWRAQGQSGNTASSASSPLSTDADDVGMALSMHQPWASLLVFGIKRYEGRGWSHSHRGRLWIASTARDPDPLEIAQLEEEYRQIYGNTARMPFPKHYPKSALLGCVDMVDCVSQDDFQAIRAANPAQAIEDSFSHYLFACENPQALRLPQTIRGQHKMWKLPQEVLAGAQQQLKPINTSWLEGISLPYSVLKYSIMDQMNGFDIWPKGYTGDNKATDRKQSNKVQKTSIPKPGLVHITNFLSLKEQQDLVDICRNYGISTAGFYVPEYEDGSQMHLQMFCLGKHWNIRTKSYQNSRPLLNNVNNVNVNVPPVPERLLELAGSLLDRARQAMIATGGNSSSTQHWEESPPNIVLVNFYSGQGRLGIHQDKDESRASLAAGLPVLSFSIGDTAEFVYADTYEMAEKEMEQKTSQPLGKAGTIRLRSGDGLLFGGPSRMVYHAVSKVHSNTAPARLNMRKGRLNLTFRTY